jgi:putative tryptophan/tyrosine transport system substrate-binding protein
VKRREFIAGLGGAAAWPFAARAQQRERMRRIGVLMNIRADGSDEGNWAVFLQTLQQLGWIEGRNVQIETRLAADDAADIRRHAAELVAAAPDVIVSTGNAGVGPLLQETRIIPIVFNNVVDPIGAGFVATMARPGGNATGFLQFEYTLSAKWLELLKEIAPRVTRAAILRDPAVTSGIGQFAVIQSVAPLVGVDVSAISLHDAGEIDRAVTAFARSPNGGLILTRAGCRLSIAS